MKKILVVDDDLDILEIIKLILTLNDFDVYTHSTGLNVPEVVMEFHPNLILLDVRLPGKSGTEICKELKEKYTIPIILISAYGNHLASIEESNADAFITLPFELNHLVNTINSHLN